MYVRWIPPTAARMPMMATTTRSSIRVNPFRFMIKSYYKLLITTRVKKFRTMKRTMDQSQQVTFSNFHLKLSSNEKHFNN